MHYLYEYKQSANPDWDSVEESLEIRVQYIVDEDCNVLYMRNVEDSQWRKMNNSKLISDDNTILLKELTDKEETDILFLDNL